MQNYSIIKIILLSALIISCSDSLKGSYGNSALMKQAWEESKPKQKTPPPVAQKKVKKTTGYTQVNRKKYRKIDSKAEFPEITQAAPIEGDLKNQLESYHLFIKDYEEKQVDTAESLDHIDIIYRQHDKPFLNTFYNSALWKDYQGKINLIPTKGTEVLMASTRFAVELFSKPKSQSRKKSKKPVEMFNMKARL